MAAVRQRRRGRVGRSNGEAGRAKDKKPAGADACGLGGKERVPGCSQAATSPPMASTGQPSLASLHCFSSSAFSGCLYT